MQSKSTKKATFISFITLLWSHFFAFSVINNDFFCVPFVSNKANQAFNKTLILGAFCYLRRNWAKKHI